MLRRTQIVAILLILLAGTAAFGFQRGIRNIFRDDSEAIEPLDAGVKSEYSFARLRYSNVQATGFWAMRGSWTVDYPKADRQFLMGVRRLTRINAGSVEHVVDLISDDIYNYPWVYVVEPGHWELTELQAKKFKEYVDRGGFVMTDDFHGTFEWDIFMTGIRRAFGDVNVIDIENNDPIFHVLYDLDERFQVPGIVNYPFQQTHEYDGFEPKWRAIRDPKGRIVVVICHNMDLGDAWEWADHPRYPEKFASLAYRIGINNIIYAMTH